MQKTKVPGLNKLMKQMPNKLEDWIMIPREDDIVYQFKKDSDLGFFVSLDEYTTDNVEISDYAVIINNNIKTKQHRMDFINSFIQKDKQFHLTYLDKDWGLHAECNEQNVSEAIKYMANIYSTIIRLGWCDDKLTSNVKNK